MPHGDTSDAHSYSLVQASNPWYELNGYGNILGVFKRDKSSAAVIVDKTALGSNMIFYENDKRKTTLEIFTADRYAVEKNALKQVTDKTRSASLDGTIKVILKPSKKYEKAAEEAKNQTMEEQKVLEEEQKKLDNDKWREKVNEDKRKKREIPNVDETTLTIYDSLNIEKIREALRCNASDKETKPCVLKCEKIASSTFMDHERNLELKEVAPVPTITMIADYICFSLNSDNHYYLRYFTSNALSNKLTRTGNEFHWTVHHGRMLFTRYSIMFIKYSYEKNELIAWESHEDINGFHQHVWPFPSTDGLCFAEAPEIVVAAQGFETENILFVFLGRKGSCLDKGKANQVYTIPSIFYMFCNVISEKNNGSLKRSLKCKAMGKINETRPIIYEPSIVSWSESWDNPHAVRYDLFYVTNDKILRHRWYYNQTWSDTNGGEKEINDYARGGILNSRPIAVAYEPGRIDVFSTTGKNNRIILHHYHP